MNQSRKFKWSAATAIALTVVSTVIVGVGPAQAGGPHYKGPALGAFACPDGPGVSGSAKFSPPLQLNTGGKKVSIKAAVSPAGCSVFGAPVGVSETITKVKVKIKDTGNGGGCLGLASLPSPQVTITWKGTLDGTVNGTTYSGNAHFASTTITTSGLATPITNPSGEVGLYLPGVTFDLTRGNVLGGQGASAPDTLFLYGSGLHNAITVASGGSVSVGDANGGSWEFEPTSDWAIGQRNLPGEWVSGTPAAGMTAPATVIEEPTGGPITNPETVTGSFTNLAPFAFSELFTSTNFPALEAACISGGLGQLDVTHGLIAIGAG